jgi:GST-like protein
MLDLYTWRTPNGRKVPILLAELDWSYELHLVDLGKNEQKAPGYLAINPNGKIPALVDRDGARGERVVVFESGAILEYLADKSGRLLPRAGAARAEVLSWLYWQVGGPGPFFGQMLAFARQTPRGEGAFAKFRDESRRLAQVLDGRLRDRPYVAGDYSIADIACYPWFAAIAEHGAEALAGAAPVRRWMERMEERPAVRSGMALEVPRARGAHAHA